MNAVQDTESPTHIKRHTIFKKTTFIILNLQLIGGCNLHQKIIQEPK